MLPKILLIISASSILVSCAGAPQKPNVELGVIDYPHGEVIVNMTDAKSFSKINSVEEAKYRAIARAVVASGGRVPLASYDRAIAFKPLEWEKVQNYLNSLTRYIQNNCSGN